MAIQYFSNLDLQQNQLLGLVLESLETAPSTPVEGQQYFNTTTKKVYSYNGTTWVDLAAQAEQLTIAADSQGVLSITDNELSINQIALTSVVVDDTETSMADFITNNYTVGNEFQEGDVIILTNATDTQQRNWIHNGGTAGTIADFTRLQTDVSESYIRGLFSASNGVSYNSLSGAFEADIDNVTIEVGVDGLQVKDGSIGATQLTTTVANALRVHKATIGDGIAKDYTITHNFATRDVSVIVLDTANNYSQIAIETLRPTDNTVIIKSSTVVSTNRFRVIVKPL